MKNSIKLLITGANGFVGSNIIKYLTDNNPSLNSHKNSEIIYEKISGKSSEITPNLCKIIAQVRSNNKSKYIKKYLNPLVDTVIEGDIVDPFLFDSINSDCSNIDVVIHTAGLTTNKHKKNLIKVNVNGTKNVINFCAKKNIPLLYISTIDVRENNSYGKSKLEAEKEIIKSNVDWIILRPSVIYGNGDKKNIASLINMIKKWHFVPMFSQGTFLRQPVYIDDVCELIKNILLTNKYDHTIYNVAGPNPISYQDIIKIISKYFCVKPFNLPLPLTLLHLFNKDFTKDKIVDISKTKQRFLFTPRSFEEGVRLLE